MLKNCRTDYVQEKPHYSLTCPRIQADLCERFVPQIITFLLLDHGYLDYQSGERDDGE